MGWDIHFYVEQKIDGVWHLVSDEKGPKDPYYYVDSDGKQHHGSNSWKQIRNNILFSCLADFFKKDGIVPIKPPTNELPSDASAEIKSLFAQHGLGARNPTYYSLTELLAGKDKVFEFETFLNIPNYRKFKQKEDLSWVLLKNDWKRDIKIISNEKMERILGLSAMMNEYEYITKVSVKLKYSDIPSHFWENTLPAMQALDDNPDNIRCIMWFD